MCGQTKPLLAESQSAVSALLVLLPIACQESMSVSQTHDTFLMYADSEKEMDGWIDAIIKVLYEVGVAVLVSAWVGVALYLTVHISCG